MDWVSNWQALDFNKPGIKGPQGCDPAPYRGFADSLLLIFEV